MYSYVPAVFLIGCQVRKLAWDGQVGGTVKGDLARTVLQRCLAVIVHASQDWDCKLEYSRSISVALLSWQPYYSGLPGCCFVEEACEAMLSRMMSRRQQHPQVVTYEDMVRLFVTLPPAKKTARGTRGSLKPVLVTLMYHRLKRLLRHTQSQPFARVLSAKKAQWEPQLPRNTLMPAPLTQDALTTSLGDVLRGALASLASGGAATGELLQFARAHFTPWDGVQRWSQWELSMEIIRPWIEERKMRVQQAHRRQQPARDEATSSTSDVPCADAQWSPRSMVPHLDVASDGGSLYEPPPSPPALLGLASDGGSLYDPLEDASDRSDNASQSDAQSLGSTGELVIGQQVVWDDVGEQYCSRNDDCMSSDGTFPVISICCTVN